MYTFCIIMEWKIKVLPKIEYFKVFLKIRLKTLINIYSIGDIIWYILQCKVHQLKYIIYYLL